MSETIGTLNIKIERLQKHLTELKQKQFLSHSYPRLKARLVDKGIEMRLELYQLMKQRQEVMTDNTGI